MSASLSVCCSAIFRRLGVSSLKQERSAFRNSRSKCRAHSSMDATGVAPALPPAAADDDNGTAAAGRQPGQQQRTRPSQGQLVERCLHPSGTELRSIDIGVNLTDRSFDKDRAAVLQRAALAGVEACIITGTCVRTSAAAAELCDSFGGNQPALYFTAGVHPHNAQHCDDGTLAQLRQLAAHPRCVAIGECGLDFNRMFSPAPDQERWLAAQLALAEELHLPLFLHCREAGARLAELLSQHRSSSSPPGVVHCFTGSREELERFLSLGMHVGITGWVCDDRQERGAEQLAALLPLIPDDRLLVETDAPYLTPRSIPVPAKQRPSRNEPALLPYVIERIAAARRQTPAHVAALAAANARRMFNLQKMPDAPAHSTHNCTHFESSLSSLPLQILTRLSQ